MTVANALARCFQSASPLWGQYLGRFARSSQDVAWYPSAGRDFRPFLFHQRRILEHRGCAVPDTYKEPTLWIFSDYHALCESPFFDHATLYDDGRTSIRIIKQCELTPDPQHYQYGFNPEHVAFKPTAATGRAFYFRAHVQCHVAGEFEADAIYFRYENVNLFTQFFLRHSVPISHLTWIRDGSALGGGRISMRFALNFARRLGLRWLFAWNIYINTLHSNRIEWPEELEGFEDIRCKEHVHLTPCKTFQWNEGDLVTLCELR